MVKTTPITMLNVVTIEATVFYVNQLTRLNRYCEHLQLKNFASGESFLLSADLTLKKTKKVHVRKY
jgi:hypothetical protein